MRLALQVAEGSSVAVLSALVLLSAGGSPWSFLVWDIQIEVGSKWRNKSVEQNLVAAGFVLTVGSSLSQFAPVLGESV